MAETPTPHRRAAAADGPEPQADAQPGVDQPAEPTKGKPVVLATNALEEFVIPGEDGADALRITSTGTALSKTEAKRVQDTAALCGVALRDLTPSDDAEKG